MERKMHEVKAPFLVLSVKDENDKVKTDCISLTSLNLFSDLTYVSKKPLQVGAVNQMCVYYSTVKCYGTALSSASETPQNRIENILDACEILKEKYDKEKENLYDTQVFDYAVKFSKMANAINFVLNNEMEQNQGAFQIRTQNLVQDFDDLTIQLNGKNKDEQAKILIEKTEEFASDLHKLNLTWDLVLNTSFEIWNKLAKENLTSEELLEVKPKTEKTNKAPKKTIQKTLLEF